MVFVRRMLQVDEVCARSTQINTTMFSVTSMESTKNLILIADIIFIEVKRGQRVQMDIPTGVTDSRYVLQQWVSVDNCLNSR